MTANKGPWITSIGNRKARAYISLPLHPRKGTQPDTLLKALKSAGKSGLTVPQIMRLGIAAFTCKISNLRDLGWPIVNKRRWSKHPKTGRTMLESVYFLES